MALTKKLKITNDLGLHGRAAAKIVSLANRYGSDLVFIKDGVEVDGSSILSILTLACPRGAEIEARTTGEDADVLMNDLIELFEKKFGEGK